jgi:hypothetical protein
MKKWFGVAFSILLVAGLTPDSHAYRKFTEMVPMTDGADLATDIYSSEYFHPGDPFWLKAYLDNPASESLTRVPLFFVLEVEGACFFWPSWRLYDESDPDSFDFHFVDVPPGSWELLVIPQFAWPNPGEQTGDGLTIFGFMTSPDFSAISGNSGIVSFGFGPQAS